MMPMSALAYGLSGSGGGSGGNGHSANYVDGPGPYTDEVREELRQLRLLLEKQNLQHGKCPSCGYCPHCGTGIKYPQYPPMQPWSGNNPNITLCGGSWS